MNFTGSLQKQNCCPKILLFLLKCCSDSGQFACITSKELLHLTFTFFSSIVLLLWTMVKLFYLNNERLAVISSGFTDWMWHAKSKSRNRYFFKLRKVWLFINLNSVKLDKRKIFWFGHNFVLSDFRLMVFLPFLKICITFNGKTTDPIYLWKWEIIFSILQCFQ